MLDHIEAWQHTVTRCRVASRGGEPWTILSAWAIRAAMFGVYLIPTLVAYSQQHPHMSAIALLNVLSGWTLVGWIGVRYSNEYP